ncbi:hypothetical protein SUDANB95_05172 [Actinosynnema sp. ALI-1.44]
MRDFRLLWGSDTVNQFGSAGGAVAGLFVGRLSGRRLVWLSLVCTQPAWLVVPWAERWWVPASPLRASEGVPPGLV